MAAMNYEMARAAAEKLIQAGQAQGLTREALISQIIAQSRAAGGAPQTATGAGLMMPPPPREVTPAAPAPMQPGVPFVAPKPVASAQPQAEAMPAQEAEPQPAAATPRPSRFRPMLEAAKAQLVEMQTSMSGAAANNQPVSMADKVRFDTQKDVVRDLEQRALAEEGAAVPEEMLAALAKREERLNRREELLQESKARSPWEALLAGGAAMKGRDFGEALREGLRTGIQEYGRSRRENIAGVEALGEARDETALKRYELEEKAREGASNLIDTQSAMQQRAITMRNNLLKSGVDEATADATVKNALANAELAEFKAKSAPEQLAMERALNAAKIEEAGRRGEPKVDVERRAYEAKLEDAVGDFKEADAEYKAALEYAGGDPKAIADPKVVTNRLAKQARALQASTAFFNRYKETPYPFGGAAMGRKAAAKPAAPSGKGWSATKF